MPQGEYHDLFPVEMIEGDIGSTSEFNHPLAELRRQFFYGTANFGMLPERFYTLPDRLNCAFGCILALES